MMCPMGQFRGLTYRLLPCCQVVSISEACMMETTLFMLSDDAGIFRLVIAVTLSGAVRRSTNLHCALQLGFPPSAKYHVPQSLRYREEILNTDFL